ncbi:MAG: T9SS type A sorting domain-containing protein [Ignavibacteriaceae bacterium]|nr:T9SS type A sorting domain-containing protein [Ignavibacteriaceae bacterium]
MKKNRLVFPFIIACSINLFSQWSNDPNNNLIVGYGLDPHICSDSGGGCYITYDYNSTSYPRWLGVERLDNYGYKPWGTLKRILGELPDQRQAEIVEDGEGGVVVSYIDRLENLPDWTQRVKVQRVDSNGTFLWNQTGVRVTLSEIYPQGGQNLCTDGNGGCVVVWHELHESLPTNTYDIRANRINNLGEREWGDTGIFLENTVDSDPAKIVRASDGNYYIQTSTIYRINQNGQILNQYSSTTLGQPVADQEGGVVLSGIVWTGIIPKLVAQRKDSLGNNLWQEPYVEVADSLYYLNARFNIQYNYGYYYYGWSGTKDGITRVTQFQTLRRDGSKLFTQGSVQISNSTPIGRPYIIPSDSGRTIFVWNDATISSTTFAQLYDTLGNKLWDENGIVVSYPAIAYQNTTDGQGGFITSGTINEFTIVAQQVSRCGNLGEVLPVPVELVLFTGSVEENRVILRWVTATELNNYGFEIERLQNSKTELLQDWKKIGFVSGYGTTTEPKSYSFTDKEITTGIYKYRLRQIDFDGTFEYSNEIIVEFDLSPKEFLLYQNYSNPFNSSTIIKYQVPKDEKVRITLYNILGEKILTLFEGEQKEGEYQISLSSDKLPSGNYFYSLEATSTRQIKKLTIIK